MSPQSEADLPDGDGYDGTAELVVQAEHDQPDRTVGVGARLRGAFNPLDGRYHWYGRVTLPDPDAIAHGATVALRTPEGVAHGRLTDVDPWGRHRIAGVGRPPFGTDLVHRSSGSV